MHLADLCICGHTREVHFGHQCSVVAGQHTILGGHFRAQEDCPCKQFVELGLAVEVFQALKQLVEVGDQAAMNRAKSVLVESLSR